MYIPHMYVGCSYTNLYGRISTYYHKRTARRRPVIKCIDRYGLENTILIAFVSQIKSCSIRILRTSPYMAKSVSIKTQ